MPHNLTPEQQRTILEAHQIEEESQHFQQQLGLIDEHITDMTSFQDALFSFSKEQTSEILAPLGRGVFMKAQRLQDEKLFVDVGAGVVVRKSIGETKEIIAEQLSKLSEARLSVISHLSELNNRMLLLVSKLRSSKQD